jgi:hypothetical protein
MKTTFPVLIQVFSSHNQQKLQVRNEYNKYIDIISDYGILILTTIQAASSEAPLSPGLAGDSECRAGAWF